MDVIRKIITLHDNEGKVIKNLKSDSITQVRVQNISIYKVQENQFSTINNNNNKETNYAIMG
jgi:hypothetical protein